MNDQLELPQTWEPVGRSISNEDCSPKGPSIIFISQILYRKDHVEKVRNILTFDGAIMVKSQGHGGGQILLWRNKDEVILSSYNKHYIEVIVTLEG